MGRALLKGQAWEWRGGKKLKGKLGIWGGSDGHEGYGSLLCVFAFVQRRDTVIISLVKCWHCRCEHKEGEPRLRVSNEGLDCNSLLGPVVEPLRTS